MAPHSAISSSLGFDSRKGWFSWAFQTMLTDLPKYMSDVLNFSISANGFLSALPYVVLGLFGTTSAFLADWLVKTGKMSRTSVRKIAHTFATVLPAIFMISASYAGCDRIVVVILLVIGIGMMGPYYITVLINPNDLSPHFAGTLMAIANTVGALAGILALYVVGILTPNQALMEWWLVFWITFAFSVCSAVVFYIWADGEIQYWNDLSSCEKQETKIEDESENRIGKSTVDV